MPFKKQTRQPLVFRFGGKREEGPDTIGQDDG